MQAARIEPNFASWRTRARDLLRGQVPPEEVLWNDGSGSAELFGSGAAGEGAPPAPGEPPRIPRQFFELAKLAACHSDPARWALLYRIAWRATLGGERNLLKIQSDHDIRRASSFAREVRRDRHKMTAFVRFRKTGVNPGNGREQFVAWFEPTHHIVELTAPFFVRRFASMDWSILTPDRCAHWDGEALQITPGLEQKVALAEDELDHYWRTYYANIFNPARLKLKAMQAEMPKNDWKNLPEAPLIAELTAGAASRSRDMIEQGPNHGRQHVSNRIPAGVPQPDPRPEVSDPADILARAGELGWREIRDAASACRSCPLQERATQTVFGEGPLDASLMIIGEQPGDQEDLVGRPFVGPAGRFLDEALQEAGIERSRTYVTNTVKHFKWTPRGKQRLHAKPNSGEVHVCKPWVIAEVLKVRPQVIVCLGATAAQALIDPQFSITRQRGLVNDSPLAPHVVATVHPSYLLRLPDDQHRREARAGFVADLTIAADHLRAV